MNMFQLVHKTLFRSLNVINVVKGRFFPKKEQTYYLFNLCTSFEIFSFDEFNMKLPLQSKYHQRLFSKAFYICIGPNFNGSDTFFVIRDTDILHFQYSEAENMFITINYFDLPKNCITPNFASFDDDQLIVSCIHGGLCGFDISKSEAQLSFDIKPCTSVLQSFPVYKNCFFRIETGPCLTFYYTKPFGLKDKRSYDEQADKQIFYSFPFGQEEIIYCTEKNLKCVSASSEFEISYPANIPFDPVIDHSPIAPSDVLILTRKGGIFRLQSNLSLAIIKPPDKGSKILRIFNIDTNHFLIINKSNDHMVFNLANMKTIQSLNSAIGLSNISVCHQKLFDIPSGFAPQVFSYSDDTLLLFRQGIPVTLLNEFELPEKPTGMFNVKYDDKDYFLISFENGSKLLELCKSPDQKISTIKTSSLPIYEDEKTLDVITFSIQPNQEKTYQVLSQANSAIPYKTIHGNSYQDKVVHTCFTRRIYIRTTEKNQLYFSGSFKRPTSDKIESRPIFFYDLNYTPTYLTISPPSPEGISEFIVMGVEYRDPERDVIQHSVVFQVISDEQSEREEIINEKFPSKICSIEFLENPDCPLGILIGLESGSLIVGEVNYPKREIETKQILQLGVLPCRIRVFKKKSKSLIFGLSTRMWLLETFNDRNLIKAHPFFVQTPSFMLMDENYRIYLISGKTFSIYSITSRFPNNPDFSVIRKKFDSQIVGVKIVDKIRPFVNGNKIKSYRKVLTPLIIVACKKEAYIIDSTCPNSMSTILSYEQETIKCISYTNRATYSKCSQPQTRDFTFYSYLAVATFSITMMQNREYALNCINIYKIDATYVSSITYSRSNDQRKLQNQKLTLLKPLISQKVNYRIDAISITSCPYTLLNQVGKSEPFIIVASSNTIFIYSSPNQKLSLLTKVDHIGAKIHHVFSCLENHYKTFNQPYISIYVSDVQKSVSLLYYEMASNTTQLISEEGSLRPISSELAPYRVDKMFYCGGDRLGNFFIFSQKSLNNTLTPAPLKNFNKKKTEPNSSSFQIQKENETRRPVHRLWFFYNINVGDVITSVDPAMDYDPNTPYPIWYSTVGGNIGCFLESTTFIKCHRLMSCIETEISKLIFSLTHCDSLTFKNKYYQSYSICDLDIVEIFHKLTPERKDYIIKKILEKYSKEFGLKPETALDQLESEILKCSSFFYLWN